MLAKTGVEILDQKHEKNKKKKNKKKKKNWWKLFANRGGWLSGEYIFETYVMEQ